MFPFPNRDASVHRDWPADVRYVAAKDGARIAEKGELGVALGNDRPLAFIRVQILVKTTVNDKRQKAPHSGDQVTVVASPTRHPH